jgi:hypothetical protein
MIETNQTFIDAWTVPHTLTGCAAGYLNVPFPLYFGLAALYEVVEYSMEYPHGHPWFGTKRPESAENVVGDLLFGCAGYFLTKKLNGA